jgi:hypothetical protein
MPGEPDEAGAGVEISEGLSAAVATVVVPGVEVAGCAGEVVCEPGIVAAEEPHPDNIAAVIINRIEKTTSITAVRFNILRISP